MADYQPLAGKTHRIGRVLNKADGLEIRILRRPPMANTAHLRLRESIYGARVENLPIPHFRILHRLDVFGPRTVAALAAHPHIVACRLWAVLGCTRSVTAQTFDEFLFPERPAYAFRACLRRKF